MSYSGLPTQTPIPRPTFFFIVGLFITCTQLAKLAPNCGNLTDLGRTSAGTCPAQIPLKLHADLKNAHVQDVAPSGDGGVNCNGNESFCAIFCYFLRDAVCGQMNVVSSLTVKHNTMLNVHISSFTYT